MPSLSASALRDLAAPARLQRLQVVQQEALASAAAFDRLTRLVARVLGTPVALITLVNTDHQVFLGSIGLPEPQASAGTTPLSHSFCQHVVAQRLPLVVRDAREHPLLHDNAAITDLGVIAYAGVPLQTPDGHILGACCAIDHNPRDWSDEELTALTDLAAGVMTEIALLQEGLARRQAEEQLQAVFAAAQDAIWAVDAEYRLTMLNPVSAAIIQQLTGAVPDLGSRSDLVTPEPIWEQLRPHYARAFAGLPSSAMFPLPLPDGLRWHEAVFTPIRRDGALSGVAVVSRDVTARRAAEEALRLRDRAIEASSSGILITDSNQPDNPIIFCNPAFERMTGYSAAEVLGRNCRFLQGPDTDPAARAQMRAALLAGEPCHLTLRNYQKDGTPFWNELHIAPVRDDAGRITHFVGVQTDVTARVEAEAARLVIERQLLEGQRLESLGLLAGGIAHDFNNLLVAILGNAELALLDLDAAHPARPSVEQLQVASRRAADLTGQLLAYSGHGRFLVGPLDLGALASEMLLLLRSAIPRRVMLDVEVAPDAPLVEGDATQLRQVLMNLVMNAVEALGDQTGQVRVRVGRRAVDLTYLAGCVSGGGCTPGTYVVLEVTDTGSGMDDATQRRIFEPFFSTKPVGHGLGLAAVMGIVRAHSGAIHVQSRPGRGSTIRVLLPPATAQQLPPAPDSSTATTRVSAQPLVLIVDDEATVRQVTARMLERLGYRVREAPDGAAGLAAVASEPSIACVLLDLTMPGLSGEETFRELHARRPGLPVVLMSGYSAQEVRSRVGAASLEALQKPFRPTDLQAVLERVQAGQNLAMHRRGEE